MDILTFLSCKRRWFPKHINVFQFRDSHDTFLVMACKREFCAAKLPWIVIGTIVFLVSSLTWRIIGRNKKRHRKITLTCLWQTFICAGIGGGYTTTTLLFSIPFCITLYSTTQNYLQLYWVYLPFFAEKVRTYEFFTAHHWW